MAASESRLFMVGSKAPRPDGDRHLSTSGTRFWNSFASEFETLTRMVAASLTSFEAERYAK
jgi:hypothetical protein